MKGPQDGEQLCPEGGAVVANTTIEYKRAWAAEGGAGVGAVACTVCRGG